MSASLRAAREHLIDDVAVGGAAFGVALAARVDAELTHSSRALGTSPSWAIVALGSYARRELCPGSDIDVMLLYGGTSRGRSRATVDDASALWYPLWDAGFVLGHSARTVKETVDLADADLDAMTSMLDLRVVVGDAALGADLSARMRKLVPRRRRRLITALAGAAAERHERPGPIAEMLQPNLKEGAGGLRDIQAPGWAGWALDPPGTTAPGWDGGVATFVERGYLDAGDPARLARARAVLLDARVALHRATRGRSDQLTQQDQDAVAALTGSRGADELLRTLARSARAVTWITSDLWSRLLATEEGPHSRGSGLRDLGAGMWLRDGRVALDTDVTIDANVVLRLAAASGELHRQLDRATLERVATLHEVEWTDEGRDAFVALLRSGSGAIGVFETLDHVGVLARLVPEWDHVRALPQRNPYHRFTVDRHSLEAVAECAAILDEPEGDFDGDVARRARADVILIAALLHDFAKGMPGDHSETGADLARRFATRIRLDATRVEELAWLVRNHLLLADTATRRDLSDPMTVTRVARAVGDRERLAALYALTIGDSRATGPSAWSASKALLLRELWLKADGLLEEGTISSAPAERGREGLRGIVGDPADDFLDAMPPSYAGAFTPETMAHHRELVLAGAPVVEWADAGHGMLSCTVVAPDRTGLLATVAATLAVLGFDISAARGYSHHDGMAVEVFTGSDRFGRLASPEERTRATALLTDALAGAVAVGERLDERTRRYRRPAASPADRDVQVVVDQEGSLFATVVEVHAPDDVGLLARVAAVFADLDLDVSQAIVSTLGDRVVDIFYLRDATGAKMTDRLTLERLRATVFARLTTVVTLD